MPAPPTSKQQQSLKTPANTKSKSQGSGTTTSWGGAAKSGAKPSGGFSQNQFGGGGGGGGQGSRTVNAAAANAARILNQSPTLRTETTVQGGQGMPGYSSIDRTYRNDPVFTQAPKMQDRVPQARDPGGSPYPDGITAPAWPSDFPVPDKQFTQRVKPFQDRLPDTQTGFVGPYPLGNTPPRPVARVQGGKGVLPYARLSQAAPTPKIQDRVSGLDSGYGVALDPSIMGRLKPRPAPAATLDPINYSDGVTRDGTSGGYYEGDGMTDTPASRVASRVTSPLVKAGFSLRQMKAPDQMTFGSRFVRSMREGGGDPYLLWRRPLRQTSNAGLV